ERKLNPPDLVICDVMLPYDFPRPDASDPSPEIKKLGQDAFRRAGVRLWQRFRSSRAEALHHVPWIYHSVLQRKSMGYEDNHDAKTYYVGKDQSFEDLLCIPKNIFAEIDANWEEPDEVESRRLQDSLRMKQRLLIAFNTPLTECFDALE